MTPDEHKAVSQRALRMWASGNSETPEDIFAESYVNHQEPDAHGGVTARDLEAWKDLIREYHGAFTSSQVAILMQVAEGDVVATRWEFTATHTGPYLDLEPTGREVTWTGVEIDRFEGGRIVESWVDWDKYRFFEGLGLIRQP